MSQPRLAQSPAIVAVQDDYIDEMLAGNDTANIAEASVVAGLYFLFLLLELFNLIRDKIGAHLLLMLFCAIRIVCFSVRAYMQKHLTENLAIVYEVFFAVGFVAIVKLLVSLLYAWTLPANTPHKRGAFSLGLLRNHGTLQERFIFLILLGGMVTNIIGATDSFEDDTTLREYRKGQKLLKAGYTIYLVAIGLYDLAVISGPILSRLNFGRPRSLKSATMVVLALEVAGLLLTTKAVFQVIAIFKNPALFFHNKLFYPLEVLPELLVLCIVCFPGFIRHVYRGSHAHPETDINRKADIEHTPVEGDADGIRPTNTSPANGAASPTTEPTTPAGVV